MRLKINTNQFISCYILLIILLMENVFYLVDASSFKVAGSFSYDIIWFILLFLFIIVTIIKCQIIGKKVSYSFSTVVIWLIALTIISSITCNFLTDQPFDRGLIPQRNLILIFLSYYAFRYLFLINKIDKQTIIIGIVVLGIISCCIYLLQATIFSNKVFLHVVNNQRDGIRLYVNSVLCVIVAFICMDYYLNRKRLFYLLPVFLASAYELLVLKGRFEIVIFFGTILLQVLMYRKFSSSKILVFIIAVISLYYFLNTQYGEYLLNSVSNANTDANWTVRSMGRDLYFSQIQESVLQILFGCGYPSELYSPALVKAGISSGVFLNDNGIFAILYVYGIFGVSFVIVWFGKMLVYSYKLMKMNNTYWYFLFIVFQIGLMYSITYWWWKYVWTFLNVILMALMEHELFDKNVTGK